MTLFTDPTWSPSEPDILISLSRSFIFKSSQHLEVFHTAARIPVYLKPELNLCGQAVISGPYLVLLALLWLCRQTCRCRSSSCWNRCSCRSRRSLNKTHRRERMEHMWTTVGSFKLKWEQNLLNLNGWKMIETPKPIYTCYWSVNIIHYISSVYYTTLHLSLYDLFLFVFLKKINTVLNHDKSIKYIK